jgi:hypothetical protein
MWRFFRKREKHDLERLATAYRCYLKASDQAELDELGDEDRQGRKWKGGFGKAIHQIFDQWPTPNQSRQFERNMSNSLKKTQSMDEAFLDAFNEYLKQKRLRNFELHEVIEKGKNTYKSGGR